MITLLINEKLYNSKCYHSSLFCQLEATPSSNEIVTNFSAFLTYHVVRGELGKTTSETFFRKVKFWPGDPPPSFVSDLKQKLLTRKSFSMSMVSIISLQKSLEFTLLPQLNTTFLLQWSMILYIV